MRRSTHTTLRRFVGTSIVAAATLIPAGAAMAADYPNGGGNPSVTEQTPTAVRASTQTSTLPFTGGDAAGLAAIGIGCAVAGTVLVRRSRRIASV